MTMTVEMQTGGYTLPVIYVDFNMMGPDKRIPALRGAWKLGLGQKVVLADHEGNRCYGRVREIREKVFYVRCLLSTWRDGPA